MMRDSQHDAQGNRDGEGLALLVRSVVARVAARDMPRIVDLDLVAAMARALVAADPSAFDAMRADLRRARIGDIELSDVYFPAVARHLGCAWVEDREPFTAVSIATARMQAMLRQISRDQVSGVTVSANGATVLVVLPKGEQHSLGAMVLTSQLRRQGVSVQLQIGADAASLGNLVRKVDFDCAMLSVACDERLADCAKLVKSLKDGSNGRLWVAIGGAVLGRAGDIARRTGADIATNDPRLVLDGARVRHVAHDME